MDIYPQTELKFYTYLYRDIDNTPIYIGKGMGTRARRHFNLKSHLGNLLRKRYREGFVIKPSLSLLMSENDALIQERVLILKYGRIDLGTGTLFNLTDGGEGSSGWIATGKNSKGNMKGIAKTGKKAKGMPGLGGSAKDIPQGPQSMIVCPHCNKSGGKGNMKRYHLDNCKFRIG